MNAAVICPGCGATIPDAEERRRHAYVGSAPGCWLLYSEVLAREYGDFRYTPVHQGATPRTGTGVGRRGGLI